MKKTTTYETTYSYNCGYLGTVHVSKTLEEAKAFEEWYKNWADEAEKYFETYKVEKLKLFGITFRTSYEKVNDWWEE